MKNHILLVTMAIMATGCATNPATTVEVNKLSTPAKVLSPTTPLPVVTPVVVNDPAIPPAVEHVVAEKLYAPAVEQRLSFNDECGNIARTVNSFALLRDSGIGMNDALLMVSSPGNFPLGPIAREVYARRDMTPQTGSSNTYQTCVKVTYTAMRSALYSADVKENREIGKLMAEELQISKKKRKK